jgi:uncharacterized protein YraI
LSRTALVIILVVIAALIMGALAITALLVVPGLLMVARQETVDSIPIQVVEGTAIIPGASPSATASTEATTAATAVVPTNAAPTTVPTIPVFTTPVQYVMALTDLNIRGGPGTGYGVVGWVADGQIAKVTGVSGDSSWWRVVCPDDSIGNCWVTARAQYTQPTTAPGSQVPPTPVPTACSDSAAMVADVTVPDGTRFSPRTGFNKTWRIRNTGTCIWNNSYTIVHAGGHLMGAMATEFPLNMIVAPGQSADLTINMVSPDTPGTYQSDWKLKTPQGKVFGVGRSSGPFWVTIVVPTALNTSISGLIYQDVNQNGVYDPGEPPVGGREVWLIPGTACHVRNDAVATALSGADGRYTLSGSFSGDYCVGLAGSGGLLDDVASVAVASGQVLNNVNLHAPVPAGSISGWLWDDYCLTNEDGDALDGNCVADGNGDFHGDGMIQPGEGYIPGVTILLQAGSCTNNDAQAVLAVTDASGRYIFGNLAPGAYCVSMNAAEYGNGPRLLPGDWTFPSRSIWYQEITLRAGENAYPVNFGWDYQLR